MTCAHSLCTTAAGLGGAAGSGSNYIEKRLISTAYLSFLAAE